MLIKFLPNSKNNPFIGAKYLVQTHDHAGKKRAEVKVLKGDGTTFSRIAADLDFLHLYTSAVIAWHKDDQPTETEIIQVLNSFENLAFAGLDKDQYYLFAVLHVEDDQSKHIHLLTPRVELLSGKSLNIAPPGWKNTFGLWRDYWNLKKGWARPDDPLRQRVVSLGRNAFLNEVYQQEGKPPPLNEKELITDWLLERIKMGLVKNRLDVIASLQELGKITRQGSNYVSVEIDGKKYRLKGAIYDEGFVTKNYIAASRERQEINRGAGEGKERPDTSGANAAFERLKKIYEQRRRENRKRYQRGNISATTNDASPGFDNTDNLCFNAVNHSLPMDGINNEQLKSTFNERIFEAVGRNSTSFDGFRKSAYERSQGTSRESEKFRGEVLGIKKGAGRFDGHIQSLRQKIGRLNHEIDRFITTCSDEATMFSQNLNFCIYLECQGYKYDSKNSTRYCALYQRGDEKIVVMRDYKNTWNYCDLNNPEDAGTITEFIQKRERLDSWCSLNRLRKFQQDINLIPAHAMLEPTDKECGKIYVEWCKLHDYSGSYLQECGLTDMTIAKLATSIKQNDLGDICFASFVDGIYRGFDSYNHEGIASLNSLGLFNFRTDAVSEDVYIFNSPLEAMLYCQNHSTKTGVFLAIDSQATKHQWKVMKKFVVDRKQVHGYFPDDASGQKMALELKKIAPNAISIHPNEITHSNLSIPFRPQHQEPQLHFFSEKAPLQPNEMQIRKRSNLNEILKYILAALGWGTNFRYLFCWD